MSDSTPASILVVDDDRDNREMFATLLATHGYRVALATNGAEALAVMRQQVPCAVLLDVQMPVMDGWEFRRQQVADPALATVPVICLTGVAPDDDQKRLGMRYLLKGASGTLDAIVTALGAACGLPGASRTVGESPSGT